jgi:hypothetical protein
VDDRRVITGIVYVLLHGIHALTDVCCRPIRFLLTGGMGPIAICVASITAAIGREYSPARGSASIGRGYDPWDMSTSRQQGVRGSGRPASTRNDTKAIEGGSGWRILSVVISGAISPPKLSLQAPR